MIYINIIRLVYSSFFKFITFIYFLFVLYFNPDKRELYNYMNKKFKKINTLDKLVYFYKQNYAYQFDKIDYDKCYIDFLLNGGDCEDVALHIKNKLNKIGYNAKRIYMINKKNIKEAHVDCIFYIKEKPVFFNYGNLVEGKDINECIKKLSDIYKSDFNFWCYMIY